MALWPKPLYHDPAWEMPEDPLARLAFDQLLEKGRFRVADSWDVACEVLSRRAIRYPFYPNSVSVEMQIALPFDEGVVIGSWLATAAKIEGSKNGAPGSEEGQVPSNGAERLVDLLALNGSSPPIHEANARSPIRLSTPEDALAYLTFFCAHVWGDEGGFWVCAEPGELPFLPGAPIENYEPQLAEIAAPAFQGCNDEGHWLFKVILRYGKSLFRATMAVQRGGMVELLEDVRLGDDLPLVADERYVGLRRISAVAYCETDGIEVRPSGQM